MLNINVANEWARKSCPAWNKNKVSRRSFREKYRDLARKFWESPEQQEVISQYKSGKYWINTYPWPYCDNAFANWQEDGSDEGYNLITDQSSFVIKYATSYVAYKIFEETGVWPQRVSSKRFDAKIWVEFLAEAGYTEIVERPEDGHRYVGINPDVGKWGSVVWFEKIIFDEDAAIISSYMKKSFLTRFAPISEFIWVRIS